MNLPSVLHIERAYKLKSIQTHVPLKMVSKYDYQIIRNALRLFFVMR